MPRREHKYSFEQGICIWCGICRDLDCDHCTGLQWESCEGFKLSGTCSA